MILTETGPLPSLPSLSGQLAREKGWRLLYDVPQCVGVGRDALAPAARVVEIVCRVFVELNSDVAAGVREQLAADPRRNLLVGRTDEDAKRGIAAVADRCEMILQSAGGIEGDGSAKAGVGRMPVKAGRIGSHARKRRASPVRPAVEAGRSVNTSGRERR